MEKMILEADLPELEFSRRGKVRDIYDMGGQLTAYSV